MLLNAILGRINGTHSRVHLFCPAVPDLPSSLHLSTFPFLFVALCSSVEYTDHHLISQYYCALSCIRDLWPLLIVARAGLTCGADWGHNFHHHFALHLVSGPPPGASLTHTHGSQPESVFLNLCLCVSEHIVTVFERIWYVIIGIYQVSPDVPLWWCKRVTHAWQNIETQLFELWVCVCTPVYENVLKRWYVIFVPLVAQTGFWNLSCPTPICHWLRCAVQQEDEIITGFARLVALNLWNMRRTLLLCLHNDAFKSKWPYVCL